MQVVATWPKNFVLTHENTDMGIQVRSESECNTHAHISIEFGGGLASGWWGQ